MTTPTDTDVVVVGGGHNGLVAAAYLARHGLRTVVLEARESLGGAVAGARVFDGVDVTLSRYAYLVSLLPEVIAGELGLDLELRSRRIASYTPVGDDGLLVEHEPGPVTRDSFRRVTGGEQELAAWTDLNARLRRLAAVVEPTLTGPLPRAADLRARVDPDLWRDIVEQPLGLALERSLADDTVRGVVLTDALIGTFAGAHDPSLRQNRCFLYHVIGRGTGEWRVPVGGMGAVARALERAARRAGAELRTGQRVVAIDPGPDSGLVRLADGSALRAGWVLANCAPTVLAGLLGEPAQPPVGCQTKVNLVLSRLPRLASGLDPAVGFAGTLHLHQTYAELDRAYAEARAGRLPDPLPAEVYCHTLTDRSILGPAADAAGLHTLTLFALHTPVGLFTADPTAMRERVGRAALASLQSVLAEPLEACLATDAAGRPCVEVKTPLDLEDALDLSGGHIFHGDLSWPWLADDEPVTTPAERWGVATGHPRLLLCGSGSRRGGAVSGLGGHSAAMAVLAEQAPAAVRTPVSRPATAR